MASAPRAEGYRSTADKESPIHAHATRSCIALHALGGPSDDESFAASLLPSSALTPGLRALAESAPSLISPQDAAHRLGVCRATVYNLCKRGVLPHVRIGSSVRLALPDVIAALARHRDRTSED